MIAKTGIWADATRCKSQSLRIGHGLISALLSDTLKYIAPPTNWCQIGSWRSNLRSAEQDMLSINDQTRRSVGQTARVVRPRNRKRGLIPPTIPTGHTNANRSTRSGKAVA
jgi:hypothetical protein